ncbi:putative RNA-binding Zn ribbon-like protein [Jiangella mangrovi]|uniref:Putative RNA-binding Zn ribbon-like protein n=1 Tax=Jiangella mangrovi TaxID=1524084 RepID=A0A7W9GRI0_9ACTN|nr:ABATE domain-containing protein [Jiangella mangrovi]MBB5788542.1 putative RNA-binding Zn ribbon-like protein [Jiangella mangrovi]
MKDVQAAGFPMGGEPSVAVDFADTVMLAVSPAVDLLEEHAGAWWGLQAARLPAAPQPDPVAARRLRAAVREAFEARIAGRAPSPSAVEDLNSFAGSVPSSLRLEVGPDGARAETRWHVEHGGNPRLAVIAREAIALVADADRGGRLRYCANDTCSMIFVAENARRVWCTANICGNRARVARHQRRRHADPQA